MKQELELELLTADKFEMAVHSTVQNMLEQSLKDAKSYWIRHINKQLHICAKAGIQLEYHYINIPHKYCSSKMLSEMFISHVLQCGKELGFDISQTDDASFANRLSFNYNEAVKVE